MSDEEAKALFEKNRSQVVETRIAKYLTADDVGGAKAPVAKYQGPLEWDDLSEDARALWRLTADVAENDAPPSPLEISVAVGAELMDQQWTELKKILVELAGTKRGIPEIVLRQTIIRYEREIERCGLSRAGDFIDLLTLEAQLESALDRTRQSQIAKMPRVSTDPRVVATEDRIEADPHISQGRTELALRAAHIDPGKGYKDFFYRVRARVWKRLGLTG